MIMKDLIGKTFDVVARDEYRGNSGVMFKTKTQTYMLVHITCCCSEVHLEDVVGDLSDLENTEIITAEKRKGRTLPSPDARWYEAIIWTFYEIATNKGSVTLRFCGEDNCYSTAVHLIEIKKDGGYEEICYDWDDDDDDD
jgi:hypothetical protein